METRVFTFTGFHLGDTALMEDNATDQLYAVVFHTEGTFCCLADGCECFRENGIQGFASVVAVFIFLCLGTQLFIGQRLHGRAESFDFVYDWIDSFQLALTVRTKSFSVNFIECLLLLSLLIAILTYGTILPLLAQDNNEFFVNIWCRSPVFRCFYGFSRTFRPFPRKKSPCFTAFLSWKQGDCSFFIYFSALRLDQSVSIALSLVYDIDLVGLCITEYEEIMS